MEENNEVQEERQDVENTNLDQYFGLYDIPNQIHDVEQNAKIDFSLHYILDQFDVFEENAKLDKFLIRYLSNVLTLTFFLE